MDKICFKLIIMYEVLNYYNETHNIYADNNNCIITIIIISILSLHTKVYWTYIHHVK